jgi:hypothetical protein
MEKRLRNMSKDDLTVSMVIEDVLRPIPTSRDEHVYYIDETVRKEGTVLRIGEKEHLLRSDTIVVFVDEEPGKNWGHDCRYLLYDVRTKSVDTIKARFPPAMAREKTTFKMFYKPDKTEEWALWD